ncbi:hypothetical protein ASD8599_00597 [Ascidiaceihabitans donghaensis]|uniref:Uncharacterized protein n=1 Tax=Ascidiaceihabitans donghaensis TaxID=1510460 RepID=A0A2R8BAF3_9RHOB|nr:hypothetical protein ASD8599_00597 [Ascidiaceihabitans donghaensis]
MMCRRNLFRLNRANPTMVASGAEPRSFSGGEWTKTPLRHAPFPPIAQLRSARPADMACRVAQIPNSNSGDGNAKDEDEIERQEAL